MGNQELEESRKAFTVFLEAAKRYRNARKDKADKRLQELISAHSACVSLSLSCAIGSISERYSACGMHLPSEDEVEHRVQLYREKIGNDG